jgi:molybdate transport system substrate-binding protein
MQRLIRLFFALTIALISPLGRAQSITVAAAADLKFCLDDIVAAFHKSHAGADVKVVYGSSGNFDAQIRQGAPFDVFFSADIAFPRELVKAGFATGEVHPYAVGRIVLWSTTLDASKLTLKDLLRADIAKVAIANPQHAPYGKRAEEALRASGIWDAVQPKLVLGENIAQTAQYVQSGNAQAGIVALSLVLSPDAAKMGGYYLIPDNLHQPLEQGFVITHRAADNALAKTFAEYVQSPPARALMVHYGFALPNEKGK